MSPHQSRVATSIASIPKDDFEAAVESPEPPGTERIYRTVIVTETVPLVPKEVLDSLRSYRTDFRLSILNKIVADLRDMEQRPLAIPLSPEAQAAIGEARRLLEFVQSDVEKNRQPSDAD